MKHSDRWLMAGLMIGGLTFTSCQRLALTQADQSPAQVQHVEGSELSRVILTEKAIQRIALKTDQVREQRMPGAAAPQKIVPYSSLIYDPHGQTWIYTSPQPQTFVRHKVDVDYIGGDTAVLNDGPPTGTTVVSVGVAELYGTEFEVGH